MVFCDGVTFGFQGFVRSILGSFGFETHVKLYPGSSSSPNSASCPRHIVSVVPASIGTSIMVTVTLSGADSAPVSSVTIRV